MHCHGEMREEVRGENGKLVTVYICNICLAVKTAAEMRKASAANRG